AAAAYKERYDPQLGGLRGAPKFPSSLPIPFLLRYGWRSQDPAFLQMATQSLEKMARGGLYDQIGGGFHRYATDQAWQVPHFEKMLYDNALLVPAYLEAFQITDNPLFRDIATQTLHYVIREMTAPQGAFYTASDADSLTPGGEREEGYYFTWTPSELKEVLGPESAVLAARYFGITPQGNFEGRTIPHVPRSLETVAREFNLTPETLAQRIREIKERLYPARLERPAPLQDEKILTGWNGLMISAFAQAGLILNDRDYLRRAAAAARFILAELHDPSGLKRSYTDGRAGAPGYIQDYAFLIAGLLDLHEASQDPRWLSRAMDLEREVADRFEDQAAGGFFMTGKGHERLLARQKPHWDGAVPSGNSVMVLNLLRLGQTTAQEGYRRRAARTLTYFGHILEAQPTGLSRMLLALDFYLDAPKEIVIVTPGTATPPSGPLVDVVRNTFLPNRMLSVVNSGDSQEALGRWVPMATGKTALAKTPTAYVCTQGSCQRPTQDPAQLAHQLEAIEPYPSP
ncbi:MAG: thioredoxin domain-containing protein, partial [Desulfobacterales bacterium]